MAGLLDAIRDPEFWGLMARQAPSNLLDAAKGNAAGLLGGPVDLAAMAMRPFGFNVENPVMGSEWIRQQTQQPRTTAYSIGEMLPMGLDDVARAAAPAALAAGGLMAMHKMAGSADNLPALARSLPGQRGALFDLTGLPNKGRDLIQNSADSLAKRLKDLGFDVSVTHSGSVVGPSSYLDIYDPQTGRRFTKQIRFSGHSKGPYNSQFVFNASSEDDFNKVIDAANEMRSLGKSKGLIASEAADIERATKTRNYWQSVYDRATAKQNSGEQLSNRERQAIDWIRKNQ